MKIEDKPLADSFLYKAARFAFLVFCLAAASAFAWAMWVLWVNAQHPFSWPWTLLLFGYLGWSVWSASHKIAKRRRDAEAAPGKICGPENSN